MWKTWFILTFITVQTSTQQLGTGCPSGFVKYNGNQKCYGFVASQTTWASALEYCSIVGGTLPQITDANIQAFLEAQISSRYKESNYVISTENNYHYHYIMDNGIDVRGQTSITFEVMACNDAHIALSKDKGVDSRDTYEIVIGGWGDHQSVIRDCKQCAHMDTNVQQQHPIDCQNYSSFWVSWTNNVIKVGKGNDVGKQTFLTWNDTAPHDVNYVAFSTGFGATGKWKVKRGNYNPGLFWIGASDLASEGNWLWLPSKQKFSYSNWAPTEPDNINYYEHCALIDLHRGYKWSDANCEERRNFICETIPNDEGNEVIGK